MCKADRDYRSLFSSRSELWVDLIEFKEDAIQFAGRHQAMLPGHLAGGESRKERR